MHSYSMHVTSDPPLHKYIPFRVCDCTRAEVMRSLWCSSIPVGRAASFFRKLWWEYCRWTAKNCTAHNNCTFVHLHSISYFAHTHTYSTAPECLLHFNLYLPAAPWKISTVDHCNEWEHMCHSYLLNPYLFFFFPFSTKGTCSWTHQLILNPASNRTNC